VEEERLATAIRIERERNIVFPETTVIIRDIQKLAREIEEREAKASGQAAAGAAKSPDWLTEELDELRGSLMGEND